MFRSIREKLLQTQKGHYELIAQRVKYFRTVGVLYEALKVHAPEELEEYVNGFSIDMFDKEGIEYVQSSDWKFTSHVVDTLSKIVEISEDWNYENLEDGGVVYIQPLSPEWNYDTFYEALYDTSWENDPVDMFIQVMFHGANCDDASDPNDDSSWTWEELSTHYGWNYPRDPFEELEYTDWHKLKRMCQLLDLECLYYLVTVSNHDGDSVFIWCNHADEHSYNVGYGEFYGEVTLQQINYWREQWDLAQYDYKQYLAGWQLVSENPGYYKVLMYLMKSCNMEKEKWYAKYRPGEDPSHYI